MSHEVAYDRLVAAAEAWPFASEPAFRLGALHLGLTPEGLFDRSTQHLADELEAWLRLRAGGQSLETLRRICEHTWFDRRPPRRPLADVIADIATRNLQLDGHRIVLVRDSDLAARLGHFRHLSLFLPTDLLVAARSAVEGIEPPDDHVSLLTPQLARILSEEPVAETHLHLGAAMSFGLLWTGLVATLGQGPPAANDLKDAPLGGAERFLYFLTAAAIARTLLAAFLRRHGRGEVTSLFGVDFDAVLPRLSGRLTWAWGSADAALALRMTLRAIARGEVPARLPLPRLQSLLRALHGARPSIPRQLADLLELDPLATWIAPRPGEALPETRFATRAIRYLLEVGRADGVFAAIFWQYQRVRGLLYRHLVQEPGTAGLDWFARHYDRLRPLRRSLAPGRFEAALTLQSRDLRLGSLEARIGPEESWADVRREVRSVADQALRFRPPTSHERPEVALLVHFIKQRTRGRGALRRLHADPAHGVRFGAWGYENLRAALAIERALACSPELLLVLRGLDVASNELSVPTWPIVPLFARLRTASRRAAAVLRRRRPRWKVEPLRATCHAGEDYGRLIEGLRRVHELIEFGVLAAGDRIGHGLCLGDDVQRWAMKAARAPQPAEERLDDLLWELDRYGRGDLDVDSGRYAHARAEAVRLAQTIYDLSADLDALIEARRMRHGPPWLARFGFPFRRSIQPDGAAQSLLHRYLTDRGVFHRGRQIIEVVTSKGEEAMLRSAQLWLRRQLASLEITIESNPSSNLLVGGLVGVEAHPSFQMAPLPGAASREGSVSLSLNTDDPVTFASSLADEYAHLYGALLRSHVPAAHALQWLAERRDQGYRSRFSLAASAEVEDLHELLMSVQHSFGGQARTPLPRGSIEEGSRGVVWAWKNSAGA